ncbi:hypothetical protein CKAH01_11142 [Colletotrichum kahawae]|uniref:Uncharacterized protein n=1 Tax=Colletotrichum kahawae TaxID=34407 RepID=A0AAD9XVR1_COLKA|nr:hypothetical protein CKAH01_11142 [Colletotrichum kahawae]
MPDDWKELSLMTRSFTKSLRFVYLVKWYGRMGGRRGLMTLVWFLIHTEILPGSNIPKRNSWRLVIWNAIPSPLLYSLHYSHVVLTYVHA